MNKQTKHVLYLSYDGLTDPLGQSQILPYLLSLTREGYRFHIVSFEKSSNYERLKDHIESLLPNKSIEWLPLTYHKKPPILSTIYDLFLLHRMTSKLVKKYRVAIVHCRSYLPMLIGVRLKRKYGVKLLFDMRGFWADERIDGHIWSLSNPIYRTIYKYFKRKEIEFSLNADHIISLTHAGKDEMTSGRLFGGKTKIPEDKITVIPCAVDLDLFDPLKIDEKQVAMLRSKLGLKSGEKVLMYLGSLGTWYLVNEMLHFFAEWKKENPEFKFVWVTLDNPYILWKYLPETNLEVSDILITQADRDEVPVCLKMADFGIFFIKPAYSKKASSAVKMGEMLAMGLPFYFNSGVGDDQVLVANGIKLAGLGNTAELKDLGIYQTTNDTPTIMKYAKDEFDLQEGCRRYGMVYKILID